MTQTVKVSVLCEATIRVMKLTRRGVGRKVGRSRETMVADLRQPRSKR